MAKSIKDLKKENTFLKSKTEKSDFTLIQLVEEVRIDFILMQFGEIFSYVSTKI